MRYNSAMGFLAQTLCLLTCSFMLVAASPARAALAYPESSWTQRAAAPAASSDGAPVLLTPAQVEALLPATVYYRGQSAPIQLRNAAGARFGADGYLLAALVDTSGYASAVQEVYQMYLITESPLLIGGNRLNPGAYGAGVVNGKFLVTDLGGHTLFQAGTTADAAMSRPRPLQLLAATEGGLRLYLGRNWVGISAAATP